MLPTIHDRLLSKLARAGHEARFEKSTCPLVGVLRTLTVEELAALAEIVDGARETGHGRFVPVGNAAPPPPVRRLLGPLAEVALRSEDPGHPQRHLVARIRGADAEGFALLDGALRAEVLRR